MASSYGSLTMGVPAPIELQVPGVDATPTKAGVLPRLNPFSSNFVKGVQSKASNLGRQASKYADSAYNFSRGQFGNAALPAANKSSSVAMQSGKNALKSQLKGLPGALNLAGGALVGGADFVGKVNAGMDLDDAAGQALGKGTGFVAGNIGGQALGSAAAPWLASLGPWGVAAAAAAPFVTGIAGGNVLSGVGEKLGGAVVDIFDRDNDFSNQNKQVNPVDSLSEYFQFLNPDEQQHLVNYMALNDAQFQLDQRAALFGDQLAREKFKEAARINLENDMAMNTLNAKIQAELQERNNRQQAAMNNSNNLWQGIANSGDFMARVYGA